MPELPLHAPLSSAQSEKKKITDKKQAASSWGEKTLESPPESLARLIGGDLFLHKTDLWRLREVPTLSSVQTPTQRIEESGEPDTMFQKKEQDKSSGIDLNKMEVYELPDRELKQLP